MTRTTFTQLKYRLALWLVRTLTAKDATVIPAPTLTALEAKVQEMEQYVSVHSGRLNDGTTRPVRRKLRARCQSALDDLDHLRSVERVACGEPVSFAPFEAR